MESASTAVVDRTDRAAGPRLATTTAILAAAGAALAGGLFVAFWVAPTDASTLGFSQKIFYFHAPIAETALLAYGVAFVAAVLYLRRDDARYDRLGVAAVRLGLFFSVLVLATGSIWGKAAWGVWWAWDARLTTFLIACLLYSRLLRAARHGRRRVAPRHLRGAVCHRRLRRRADHVLFDPAAAGRPAPGRARSAGQRHGRSRPDRFLISMAGMTLLFVGLLRIELGIEALREELQDLKYRLGRGRDVAR